MRGIGRAALWVTVALLLVRGAAGVLTPPQRGVGHPSAAGAGEASGAFAARFARAYLADPSPQALAPFLAEGAHLGAGRAPSARGAEVAQAEVAQAEVAQAEVVRTRELGGGRALVTVACELRDSRTLYLAVPIVRSGAGEVAALGAPSMVAVPAAAGVDSERPQPLAGPDAAAIEALVRRFLPTYLSARGESELSYLLAPGAGVIPLAGAVELLGLGEVSQLGPGVGPRRTVIASARVRAAVGGAVYPLAYRLSLVKRSRWYVEAVQGALP